MECREHFYGPSNDERRKKIINCILLRKDELAKTTQSNSEGQETALEVDEWRKRQLVLRRGS